MKDNVLDLFKYAVENNLWDLIRGLYPEVVQEYREDYTVISYAEEAIRLMNIRMSGMRGGVDCAPATSYKEW